MNEIPKKLDGYVPYLKSMGDEPLERLLLNQCEIIDYLHADKKLRDEQFEAILKAFNATGIVLKDLVDIELDNK